MIITALITLLLLTTHPSHSMNNLKQSDFPEAIVICFTAIKDNNIEALRHGLSLKPDINYEIGPKNDKMSLLCLACMEKNDDIVVELLKQENIDILKRAHGIPPIHLTCGMNLPKATNIILKKNPHVVHMRLRDGMLPLHAAAKSGSKNCIEQLLSIDPSSIDKQDYKGDTALHYACKDKKLDCIKLLLINGARATIKNHHQTTPLWTLFNSMRNIDVLLSFFDNDFYNAEKLKCITDEYGNSQLHLCATAQVSDDDTFFEGVYQLYVKFLISLGMSKETKNNDGKTAVDLARDEYNTLNNQYKIEKLPYLAKALKHQYFIMDCLSETPTMFYELDDLSIDINTDCLLGPIKNNNIKPSFATQACLNGIKNNRLRQVQLSLLGEVDVNFINTNGSPLLYTACEKAGDEIIMELLKQNNIDITLGNTFGATALHKVCTNNRPIIVDLLLAKNPNSALIKNIDGYTPFDKAMNGGHTECIELLLTTNNKNINHQNSDGNTPLHKICMSTGINLIKIFDIIKLFLINGACTTMQNNLQATPLSVMFSFLNHDNINHDNCFHNFFENNPGIAEEIVQTTDTHKNNQFHLCTRLQSFNDEKFPEYLTFLTSHGLDIHSRNADGKTAVDCARDAYNRLYNQYMTTQYHYIKKALDQQERLMHAFLCFTPSSVSCARFMHVLKQTDTYGLLFPEELLTYIARIYYALNLDTIVAKKYKNNKDYYPDFIENKNEIKINLLAQPEPHLLWSA